jgi:hypothetical protein
VLRRLIAGLALWALLAGCSGAVTPSALDRSICTTVRTELASLPLGTPSVPPYMESESRHLLASSGGASSVVVFVRTAFAHDLTRSGDPTFQRVGRAFQHSGNPGLVKQLGARCSALGL